MTPTQKLYLDFIEQYIKEKGYSPSYREIAKAVNVKSTNSVFTMIKELQAQGYLEQRKRKYRTIKLSSNDKIKILQKQLDMAVKCLEKYADHENWQDECAGAIECLFIDDYGYREAETVLEQIKELNNETN